LECVPPGIELQKRLSAENRLSDRVTKSVTRRDQKNEGIIARRFDFFMEGYRDFSLALEMTWGAGQREVKLTTGYLAGELSNCCEPTPGARLLPGRKALVWQWIRVVYGGQSPWPGLSAAIFARLLYQIGIRLLTNFADV
jgi:hypothetical protein